MSKLSYLGKRSKPRENVRARGPRKRELAMISHEFSFPHWKPRDSANVPQIREVTTACQVSSENLFQPSKQTGSFDVVLVKRILRAEDKSD